VKKSSQSLSPSITCLLRKSGAATSAGCDPIIRFLRKPSFPVDPVAQTAAIFAALAAARGPTSAAVLAGKFRKTKNLEKAIFDVLSSLARLGHVTTSDGENFEIRRAA
jgi:hypothetical protein